LRQRVRRVLLQPGVRTASRHTYKSEWYGDKDYNADRVYSDGHTLSYHHYEAVSSAGADPYWTFTNSVDAYRQTVIQRGGSTSSSWEMWEWALGSCS